MITFRCYTTNQKINRKIWSEEEDPNARIANLHRVLFSGRNKLAGRGVPVQKQWQTLLRNATVTAHTFRSASQLSLTPGTEHCHDRS